jgi:putative two-component system response regulator
MMSDCNKKSIVLVVDDTPENIDVLSHVLKSDYKVKAALDGRKALRIADTTPRPDIILLDIMMPEIDGYEVCRQLKDNPATAKIPIIFITAKNQDADEQKGLELGAVDFITKPINPAIVKSRVSTHLALHDQNIALENKVKLRTEELNDTRLKIIHRLGRAAEFKDNETGLHVIRMSHYSKIIAEALNYDDQWPELIFNAAPMHDIGKIGIPDHILLKPGKLDEDEWELMRQHPQFGADIIGDHDSEILKMSKEIALTHHEKWDGTGYPNGLKGTDIPLFSRIIAVADVFDALTTERPYKKAWAVEDAVNFIDENSGAHFDPDLVVIFHEVLPSILEIKEKYSEEKN